MNNFRILKSYIWLLFGFLLFVVTKKNTEKGYQALISTFCSSKGKSNDFLSKLISFFEKRKNSSSDQILSITKAIKEDGFFVLDNYLSKEDLNSLEDLTREYKCSGRGSDDKELLVTRESLFENASIKSTRLDYSESDLVKSKIVQKIATDPLFTGVAEQYLASKPKIDIVALWWTIANKKINLVEDAQMYHFDMDRIKWLKIFVYLSDVNSGNGPHKFIRASHLSGKIPSVLLKKGYSRLEDQELFEVFDAKDEITFCGQRGTIIFEDTRGLHKGQPILDGHRLVFQLEYTNSLFGAPTNKHITNFVPTKGNEALFSAYSNP